MKLRTFTIPKHTHWKYPLPFPPHLHVPSNSWFDISSGSETDNAKTVTTDTILRCERVDLKLTQRQAKVVDRWFEIYRIAYNKTVEYLRSNKLSSFITLRKDVKSSFTAGFNKMILDSKIPIHTVDNAIKDVHKAYKSSIALHKKTKRPFRVRYKKIGCDSSMAIEGGAFSDRVNGFAVKVLGTIKSSACIKGNNRDSRLKRTGRGFHLYVPREVPTSTVADRVASCGVDPGLRTFQTVCDSNGHTREYCTNYTEKIKPLFEKIYDVAEFQGQRWHKKYTSRLRAKIKNLTDDLHWKTAKDLVSNFDQILIGKLSTRGVLGGDLQPTQKVLLQSMSHYTFRMRLKAKCEQYGCDFVEVEEHYTSKTCGHCSKINGNLGRSKTFTCDCGYISDRDQNAARNIMIKHLVC